MTRVPCILQGSGTIGTQIFLLGPTLVLHYLSHIFAKLQFHHHSFIIIYHIYSLNPAGGRGRVSYKNLVK